MVTDPGPILEFQGLSVDYMVAEGAVRSVEDVSLLVPRGQVTALVGESGSGKSTLTSAVLGLTAPNARIGEKSRVLFDGKDILRLSPEALRQFRWRRASLVFQAAQNALNPTLPLGRQLVDSLQDHGGDPATPEHRERLNRLLGMVRLDPDRVLPAYPHQLSGGMRQRAIIAMALMLEPELVILDEPTTALDVITQSYIFDILQEIHEETGLSMLFITHDMAAVAKLADRIAVMYAGRIFEVSSAREFFETPKHPYSQGLLRSIPSVEGDRIERKPIEGQPPDLIRKPPGCVFHPRCGHAVDVCRERVPPLETADEGGHLVACHRWREVDPS